MDQQEWDMLMAIREEMSVNMMALNAATQEKFTELLVKSLEGKGDLPLKAVNPTFPAKRRTL